MISDDLKNHINALEHAAEQGQITNAFFDTWLQGAREMTERVEAMEQSARPLDAGVDLRGVVRLCDHRRFKPGRTVVPFHTAPNTGPNNGGAA